MKQTRLVFKGLMSPATTKKNPLRSSREVPGFKQNWNFWTDFHKNVSNIKLHEAHSGSRVVLMRTDGQARRR
jgi:hypothetical protein